MTRSSGMHNSGDLMRVSVSGGVAHAQNDVAFLRSLLQCRVVHLLLLVLGHRLAVRSGDEDAVQGLQLVTGETRADEAAVVLTGGDGVALEHEVSELGQRAQPVDHVQVADFVPGGRGKHKHTRDKKK